MVPDPTRTPRRPTFASPTAEAAFTAAYDAVLARWPVPVEPVDLASEFGTTHVQVCGPADGPPLVLLHGGGATSTVWFAVVGELARRHRVYAVDQIGDAGRSVHDGRPLRGAGDFAAWLDTVLDGLGVPSTALAGHSYGGWLALTYALSAPGRVSRLVLLDPAECFTGTGPAYRLRAIPLFVRPSAERMRRFLAWETRGAALDPTWLHLVGLAGGEVRGSPVVLPRRPDDTALRTLTVPTLQVLAERSRSLDPRKAAARAAALLPDVRNTVLPGASHHTIPTEDGARLARVLTDFLA
jgi:pimeloyl-ACP methyl ester carboxylesterase